VAIDDTLSPADADLPRLVSPPRPLRAAAAPRPPRDSRNVTLPPWHARDGPHRPAVLAHNRASWRTRSHRRIGQRPRPTSAAPLRRLLASSPARSRRNGSTTRSWQPEPSFFTPQASRPPSRIGLTDRRGRKRGAAISHDDGLTQSRQADPRRESGPRPGRRSRVHPPARASAFGAWIGVRITLMPSLRKISSNAWQNFASRSWTRGTGTAGRRPAAS
jgi:hypothetical protein